MSYRTFHGVEPNRIDEKKLWVPGELTLLGDGVDVGYGIKDRRSSKDGWYVHDFGAVPLMYFSYLHARLIDRIVTAVSFLNA
jgi:hypothetical protein